MVTFFSFVVMVVVTTMAAISLIRKRQHPIAFGLIVLIQMATLPFLLLMKMLETPAFVKQWEQWLWVALVTAGALLLLAAYIAVVTDHILLALFIAASAPAFMLQALNATIQHHAIAIDSAVIGTWSDILWMFILLIVVDGARQIVRLRRAGVDLWTLLLPAHPRVIVRWYRIRRAHKLQA